MPKQGSPQAGRLRAQGLEGLGDCGSRKLGLSDGYELTLVTDRLDLSGAEQCGDKAPGIRGLCQGDPSGLRLPWPCRSWGSSQGPVSQCVGQKRGQCGGHRVSWPAGRSGGAPCVPGCLPFPH